MNLSDRSETEERLTAALKAAKDHYESTKHKFEIAMELTDGGRKQYPSIEDLEEAHKEAIQQYRRALLDFNHFLFESKPMINVRRDGLPGSRDGLPGSRDGLPEKPQ